MHSLDGGVLQMMYYIIGLSPNFKSYLHAGDFILFYLVLSSPLLAASS